VRSALALLGVGCHLTCERDFAWFCRDEPYLCSPLVDDVASISEGDWGLWDCGSVFELSDRGSKDGGRWRLYEPGTGELVGAGYGNPFEKGPCDTVLVGADVPYYGDCTLLESGSEPIR
jgi:hypothetical protein